MEVVERRREPSEGPFPVQRGIVQPIPVLWRRLDGRDRLRNAGAEQDVCALAIALRPIHPRSRKRRAWVENAVARVRGLYLPGRVGGIRRFDLQLWPSVRTRQEAGELRQARLRVLQPLPSGSEM